MPNRILKESICTSESLTRVSDKAEILFYRLIVKADDFGLYYANPKLISSLCFPLNAPDENEVKKWLDELINEEIIGVYMADDGKKYLKLLSWEKHQNTRANKPKFPQPQRLEDFCEHLHANDINCEQANTNVPVNVNVNVFENVNENVNDTCARAREERVEVEHEYECEEEPDAALKQEAEKSEEKPARSEKVTPPEADFKEFWSAYPRKVGKKDAEKAWHKIRPDPAMLQEIINGLEEWKKSQQWQKDGGSFIPYPATFLRSERWTERDDASLKPLARAPTAEDYKSDEPLWDFAAQYAKQGGGSQ